MREPASQPLSSQENPEVGPAPARTEYVRSLERGLAVIRAFSRDEPQMTLTAVAQAAQISRAAARRSLFTLRALGYVASEGRQFFLTARTLDLGYAYLSSMSLWAVAQSYMEELVEEFRESCSASVLDCAEIVYVVRVPAKRIMSISLSVGTRLPAFATSMGRVLLADLEDLQIAALLHDHPLPAYTGRTLTDPARMLAALREARQRGYALVDQELEEGVRSIAVPIRDRRGRALAAMNISSHVSRVTVREMTQRMLPRLKEMAARVTRAAEQR